MKVTLLNNRQREKILERVAPVENDYYSYQNLDLCTAVADDSERFFLTLGYYLSASIKRTDDRSSDYTYVLLADDEAFLIPCTESYMGELLISFSPIPEKISDEKLSELVQYYRQTGSERRHITWAQEKLHRYTNGYTADYLSRHYF